MQRALSRKSEIAQERAVKVREKLTALAKAEGFSIDEFVRSQRPQDAPPFAGEVP